MKQYDAVIFDLDGTLLNTLEDLTDSVNYVMQHFHFAQKSISQVRSFVGNGVRKLVARCVPGGEDREDFEEILQYFRGYYTKHCQEKTTPYRGICQMLQILKAAGYRMAIVSNKNDRAVMELNEIFFAEYITVAIGQNDAMQPKPSPDSVNSALERLGCQRERALYVGDSDVDRATAQNAGMDCVLVSWGFRDRELLESLHAAAVIDEPCQLAEYLGLVPKVTYIGHSGFCVETKETVFLFDFSQGKIPQFSEDATIYVFSSHRHQDHFQFAIFDLAEQYENVIFVLSADITKKYKSNYLKNKRGLSDKCCESIVSLDSLEIYEDAAIRVRALPSTDIGVAFVVTDKSSGTVIYHAGDLNWWTWEGESEKEYAEMTKAFQDSVGKLCEYDIDIAFLPLDPRQEARFYLGFDYVMRNTSVQRAYPMHCWDDYSVIDRLLQMDCSLEYRDKVVNTGRLSAAISR